MESHGIPIHQAIRGMVPEVSSNQSRFASFQSPEIQPYFEKWGFGPDMVGELGVAAWDPWDQGGRRMEKIRSGGATWSIFEGFLRRYLSPKP